MTNSLRSFRGSIYGNSQTRRGAQTARMEDTDLEKGTDDYGDKEFDRALNASEDSFDDMVSHYPLMLSTAEQQA